MATIQGVYVALFGRPADPTGLAYFNSVTKNGADLSGIGDLASTAEYKARFDGQSNTQIVTAIYQSLFNRAPETAGLTFFVDALNKGTLNIKNIAIAILDGAQGDDKIIVTNKLTAADNFTKAIDTPIEVGSYQGTAAANSGRTFLQGVTKDTNSIPSAAATDAAILAIQTSTPGSTGTAGVSITVAAATDIVSTTVANPALKSTAGDDTINVTQGAAAAAILTDAAKIDAGAGTDTLIYKATTGNGADATAGGAGAAGTSFSGKPGLVGVEKIFTTVTGGNGGAVSGANAGGTAGSVTIDVSGSTGVRELWNDTSKVGTIGGAAAAGGDLTYNNIVLGTTVGIKGDVTNVTTFAFAGATGAADAATLALENATGAAAKAVTINGIETLNVSLNGTSSINVTDNTLDKVVVTGTGNFTFASSATTTKSFDASALNGSATVDLQGAVNGVTVTGTKFADTITLNSTGGLTTDKDVVVYNTSNISTAAVLDKITNFATGEDKIDVKAFALTAPATVTNLTAAPAAGANTVTSIAKFFDGTDTIVYIDSNKSNTFDANDLSIKLAGNIDVKVTDFTFA